MHVDVVDSLQPPAILLTWDDPWLTGESFGPCLFEARLGVLCIASRVEPGPGVEALEQLAVYVIERMRADAYSWPQASSQIPRAFEIGGITYLGAVIGYSVHCQPRREGSLMQSPTPLILDDASIKIGADGSDGHAQGAGLLGQPHRARARHLGDDGGHDVRLGRLPGTTKWSLIATLYQSFDADATEDVLAPRSRSATRSLSRWSATSRSRSRPTIRPGRARCSRSPTRRSTATLAMPRRSSWSGRWSKARPSETPTVAAASASSKSS